MKIKIIILQAFLIAQYKSTPVQRTCSLCLDAYKMCTPAGN